MEADVPAYLDSVLRERLQNNDKQEAIELYYELLSSGHSVGEILESLGHTQCKSEHGNLTTAEHPMSGFDGVAPEVTSEAALMGVAQANTRHSSGLTSPPETESCRTEEPRITESTPLNELGSGDWEQFPGEGLPGSEPDSVRSATAHASTGGEIAIISGNQEPLQPGKFSTGAKRIACGALYTIAVASVSITSFAIVSGRNADLTTTRIQSGISSGTEAVAVPGLAAGRSETVMEIPKSNKQFVNADTAPVPEPSRSAEPGSAASRSLRGDAVEVPTTFSASTAHIGQAAEPSRWPHAPAINHRGAVELETGHSGGASVPMAREIAGQQIVRAFYTALEKGNGETASSLVIPAKRAAGPFSAGELSRFYGRLEQPFRLIEVDRAGENLYNVAYSYKVRNGRFCNGRSLVTTISLQNQVLIEKIQSPSRC
jgi:hypothetical protein